MAGNHAATCSEYMYIHAAYRIRYMYIHVYDKEPYPIKEPPGLEISIKEIKKLRNRASTNKLSTHYIREVAVSSWWR